MGTRRSFLKTTAAAALTATATSCTAAKSSPKIRIGIVGCGYRMALNMVHCLAADPDVEIAAFGDLFPDKIDLYLENFRKQADRNQMPQVLPRIEGKKIERYTGFDACQKIVERDDINLVCLATPPGFRPETLRLCLDAGKHVFMEKPGAVDPVGVRSLLQSAALADKKGLCIVPGFQQRWTPQYLDIKQRLQDGAIGPLVAAKAFWVGDTVDWHHEPRLDSWSDMEYQIRCWPYFTWLSGDHLVEQLIHNIDCVNWFLGALPESCTGLGGRQVRTGADYGNIYDHFAVEYTYPGNVCVTAMATQIKGSSLRINNEFYGPKGHASISRQGADIHGDSDYKFTGDTLGDIAMFRHLYQAIRSGRPVNLCREVAHSTLTAIMGRTAAYTGRQISWKWILNASQLSLDPGLREFGPLPVAPVAMPGITPLV
jgi:myo-inositol 2-dehydrogenase / D-chiro-inositol 1-dehydrogenase